MNKNELEKYFFPTIKILKFKNKYFDCLKKLIKIKKFYGYKKYTEDKRYVINEKFELKIERYLRKNKNDILTNAIESYGLMYPCDLSRVLLHSIVIDEALKTKPKDYDVYHNNDCLLFLDNKNPIILDFESIVDYCKFKQTIIFGIRDYYDKNPLL